MSDPNARCRAIGARCRPGVALIVLLLLGLVFSVPAAARQHHPHKCKHSQATVKIRGKRKCKPIRSVFPKPHTGDERIGAWKTSLNPARSLRDHRGRKLPSLMRGHGEAGRKIYAAIAATMPEGFAHLDALANAQPKSLDRSGLSSAARCGNSGPPETDSFSRTANGVRVDASLRNSGDSKSMVFRVKSGDAFLRTSLDEETCSSLNIPSCPTADGALDSKGDWVKRLQIKVLYFKDADLVSQLVLTETRTTRTSGQTAADAKLDHLDIDDALDVSIFSTKMGDEGGSRENFELKRRVRVNMRSRPESYEPGNKPSETFTGRAPRLAGWDEKGFANLVSGLIGTYRGIETGGGFADTPGKCAELKFSPGSDTLKLRKDQRGKVDVRVESNGAADNRRATAAESVVTRISQANATFNPPTAQGKAVGFDYKVTRAGSAVKVSAGFKATSTAGLAADATWTQPTFQDSVKRITGTFGGEFDYKTGFPDPPDTHFVWNGTVTFTRDNPDDPGAAGSYTLGSGEVDVTATGTYLGCEMSGSKRFTLGPGFGSAMVTSDASGGGAPYSYKIVAYPYALPPVQGASAMDLTLSSCTIFPELNGTTKKAYVSTEIISTGFDPQISADGLSYEGSRSEPVPGSSWKCHWSLQGKLTP